ncbi:MAG TPA: glucose-1-phosphate thymidylyltransferase [Thermococcus sp.]|nr:glucose-1-phosphate thymidylyltransferase [Candidatus Baldrarchaeota archaeon]HDH44616.1 glucose-1-phosphate thymidylyltransferase [Thermococcus sp.]
MKGVVLHGGAGTRLRPLTFSGPKQLIPVANKPVSQYVVEDLRDSGVRDIAIVLGETFPELVREHYGDGGRFGVRVTYVYQGKPLGIAHAVGLCRDFVGDNKFVVYLGDNLLQHGIKKYVDKFLSGDYDAMVLLKEVDDPGRFGVAEFDEGGRLVRVVEKPKVPPSNYALVGVYFFTPVVFKAIEELKPSWRGEYEITDAIQMLIDWGFNVGYEFVEGWWVDTGKKDDILAVNALILDERAKRDVKGEVVDSRVEGRVEIGEGTRVVNSIVRGPVIIGRNCLIENSFIGPYTSVGNNARIVDSGVEYSIVMEGAVIDGVERLEESLIGRRAKVLRNRRRNVTRLHVGDYSEVEI